MILYLFVWGAPESTSSGVQNIGTESHHCHLEANGPVVNH